MLQIIQFHMSELVLMGQKDFLFFGPKIWDLVPTELKQLPKIRF